MSQIAIGNDSPKLEVYPKANTSSTCYVSFKFQVGSPKKNRSKTSWSIDKQKQSLMLLYPQSSRNPKYVHSIVHEYISPQNAFANTHTRTQKDTCLLMNS